MATADGELARLRGEVEKNPSRNNLLRLADELYAKDDAASLGEALGMYLRARSHGGFTPSERMRLVLCAQRLKKLASRGVEVAAPGLHRPMDEDRNPLPHGAEAGKWDRLPGSIKQFEGRLGRTRVQVIHPGVPWRRRGIHGAILLPPSVGGEG